MTAPVWSILVPTVPERAQLRQPLMDSLYAQARPYGASVAVMMLEDDRTLDYGDKLQTMVDMANGTFISFVDDDDWVADDFVDAVLQAIVRTWPDAVTFDVEYTMDGDPESRRVVRYVPGAAVETAGDGSFVRPIQHLQPVKEHIVRAVRYEGGFGADTRWSTAVAELGLIESVESPVRKPDAPPLYEYRWRSGDPDNLWR